MYESANNAMNTGQIKALIYHDRKEYVMMLLKKMPKYMFNYPEKKETNCR